MEIEEKLERLEDGKKAGEKELSVEERFESQELNITTGVIPSLNVAAGLLGFFFIKLWTSMCEKFGWTCQPFTRQENTVIQTCVVAISGIAFSSGYASYIFVGLFSILSLRKIMIIDYKLIYPSGTATAYLINMVRGSFVWAFFQWFFTADNGCGFAAFPTFWSSSLCTNDHPYSINLSMLLGSIVSWGLMWPLIEQNEGKWYPAHLASNNLSGIQGYRVFIAIAMILGDGLFQFFCAMQVHKQHSNLGRPRWLRLFSVCRHGLCSQIFPSLKWYHIAIIYIFAPILAFCNAYGCGLTDWSLASTYGKLAIFIFGAWVGLDKGGIIAALAACGVMMSIVSTASDLMQDFKTGYLTLASPRSMFFSQVLELLLALPSYPDLGTDTASNPAPFGALYRGIALLATQGLSALPKNCLKLCIGFFFFAILVNIIKQVMMHYKNKAHKYLPSPIAMAVPFYLGGYFAIDMCVGSLYRYWRERNNKAEAEAFVPAVASGLICGDSLWGMPASALSLLNAKPPMCMKFLSRATNTKVDTFLQG
ncbi:hypothetical protein MKW92_012312 [Papaver armeniacum]|nr:hypothetical protein MKW92_012312 [Papaver armeniacum]